MNEDVSQVNEDLENTMLDVRKAYRLLHLYQQSVFELVQEIAKAFNYKFYRWVPKFEVATNEKIAPFSWKGLGMLPMYDISFLFLDPSYDRKKPRQGEWLLDISVQSDDGYKVDHYRWILNQVEFEHIKEDSNTLIGLYAIQFKGNMNFHEWYDIWNNKKYPMDGNEILEGDNIRVIGKYYNAAEWLADQNTIIKEFKDLLQKSGIPC